MRQFIDSKLIMYSRLTDYEILLARASVDQSTFHHIGIRYHNSSDIPTFRL